MKTRLILKPGKKGTKRLTEKYGDALICVRFRYDVARRKRFKTVELIEEEADWTPPPPRFAGNDIVPIRIAVSDMALRQQVKTAGGKWVPEEKLWYVRYGSVAGRALEKHIYIDNLDNKGKR
jgi:hypothetical protein